MSLDGIVSKRANAPLYARQPRALHVIQHTDRNLSSSHTHGTRFTANAFASTVASDVPAVRSCTSRCSQVFPRNSSMDVRCCGVRNDIVGAAQDCSRGPD
jgi:hypothetical protein